MRATAHAWVLSIALAAAVQTSAAEVDPETGLVLAPGVELVKANCTVCHSAKLVTQMRGDREAWLSLIRWMQRTQNLWQFPPQTEAEILDYLSTHYAPTRVRLRRAPLGPELPPPRQGGR